MPVNASSPISTSPPTARLPASADKANAAVGASALAVTHARNAGHLPILAPPTRNSCSVLTASRTQQRQASPAAALDLALARTSTAQDARMLAMCHMLIQEDGLLLILGAFTARANGRVLRYGFGNTGLKLRKAGFAHNGPEEKSYSEMGALLECVATAMKQKQVAMSYEIPIAKRQAASSALADNFNWVIENPDVCSIDCLFDAFLKTGKAASGKSGAMQEKYRVATQLAIGKIMEAINGQLISGANHFVMSRLREQHAEATDISRTIERMTTFKWNTPGNHRAPAAPMAYAPRITE